MLVHRGLLAVLATATIALAGGCTGGGGADPSASPSGDVQAAALEYAKCLRAHGYPDYPDPIRDDEFGWVFPESAPQVKPDPPECLPLGRHLKELIRDTVPQQARDLPRLREFAKCMRENGVPNFPDPNSSGEYEWADGERPAENDPSVLQAQDACKDIIPPKGGPSPTG